MNARISAGLAAMVMVCAAPANAALYLTVATGTLNQLTVSGPPRLDGSFFQGQPFTLAAVFDDPVAALPLAPPGGRGQAQRFQFAAVGWNFSVGGASIMRTLEGAGTLNVLNNVGGGAPPTFPFNVDQVSHSTALRSLAASCCHT